MCFPAIQQYLHHTATITLVTTLTVSHALTSRNYQKQGLSRFVLHQFSQLLPHATNHYTQKHTETVFPRLVSSVAIVTSVITTATSTGDCHMQVFSSSLTGVCLFVGCLTSQQQASVSQGRICSDNFTCCHTEIEVADPTFYLTQSQCTDTGPNSPSTDPITPGAWQGSHWSTNV